MQPRALLARTQPYDVRVQLASLLVTYPGGGWWTIGESALWLYAVSPAPTELAVAIPLGSELAVRPPILCRRLSPSVLQGVRTVQDVPVVAFEVAVIQWAYRRPASVVVSMVERVLRERRTTLPRLRARLSRGLAGSAAVRAALTELCGGSLERDVRRLRAALERHGVTGLRAEVRFVSQSGASAYADLLHEPSMTVLEVDASLDHLERGRFRADRRRDRWMLRDHDVVTVRVDVGEIREDVDRVAHEIAGLLLHPPRRHGGQVAGSL